MGTKFRNIHEETINLCRKEDTAAQYKLYKLYYKAMYNTALRIVSHSAEAEDLMQEAFLSAFQKIDTYKGDVSFGAWLKKIVVHKCLDFLRKKQIKWEEITEKTNENVTFEEEFENNEETINQVTKEIANLPQGYRVVLSLFFLEGYDHEEISEILGITASASRSQLTRAKQKLLESLRTLKK